MKAKLAALDAKEKRNGSAPAPSNGPPGPNPPPPTDDIPFYQFPRRARASFLLPEQLSTPGPGVGVPLLHTETA
jgi:hypothetical protein